jgi:XRE family transcriptional regulator, regulator of sulfur utilization
MQGGLPVGVVLAKCSRISCGALFQCLNSTTVPKQARSKRTRGSAPPPGDDVGAADLGQRVAENVRTLRRARGMSLDELAHASGVSRAALSQIETNKTNPTIGLLWKVTVGFGIPFSEILGDVKRSASILRRSDAQVLQSADRKFHSRPLAPAGSNPFVELYELRLAARARHAAEAHAPGTREIVIVLSGALRLTTGDDSYDLGAGDSVLFSADQPHVYENPGTSESRYHDVIIYPR